MLGFIYKMTKTTKYNIIRVPRTTPFIDVPVSFPPLGRLYLELMENKEKVIPSLANVEHIPKSPGPQEPEIPVINSVSQPGRREGSADEGAGTDRDRPSREPESGDWDDKYKKVREVFDDFKKKNENREARGEERNYDGREDGRRDERPREDGRRDRDERQRDERHREDGRRDRDERQRDERRRDERPRGNGYSPDEREERRRSRDERDREDRYEEGRGEDVYSRDKYKDGSEDERERRGRSRDRSDASDSEGEERKNYSEASSDSEDDLSNRLKKLLADSDSEKENKPRHEARGRSYRDEYDRHDEHRHKEGRGHEDKKYRDESDRYKREKEEAGAEGPSTENKYSRQRERAPTLAELEAGNHHKLKKELPDLTYNEGSAREEEELKREMLFKFELLKKSYKGSDVPSFTIHSDLATMERTYESTLKSLSLDASVADYKKYLLMAFMGIEFALGTVLKFDMEGFTQQQILSMNSYERLLLEMGEKSYVPGGSKFPVEVRLLFLVAMNTAIFLIGKMFSRRTGFNPTGMLSQISSSATSGGAPRRRRPMRGPGMDPDDLPTAPLAAEAAA